MREREGEIKREIKRERAEGTKDEGEEERKREKDDLNW